MPLQNLNKTMAKLNKEYAEGMHNTTKNEEPLRIPLQLSEVHILEMLMNTLRYS